MKKIVMVTRPIHPVPPQKGAAVEWWMFQVSKRLTEYEPHIISITAPGYADYECVDGVHLHRVTVGSLYRLVLNKWLGVDPYPYSRRVAEIIGEVRPDILHFHSAHDLLHEVAGLLSFRPKLISHLHNEFSIQHPDGMDLIITCSEYLKRFYAAKLHAPGGIKTVYNGVDLKLFKAFGENRVLQASTRAQLGIPASAKIILYVGRISPEKGPHLLVEAFGRVLKDWSDVYLVLVGEVRQTRKGKQDRRYEYSQQIIKQCAELGDRVRLVGVVSPDTVPVYYSLGYAAVLPSIFEDPFPMVAIECMAAEVPLIVSAKGGFPEYITHGVNGLFLDGSRPVEDLADKLKLLVSDEALAKRLGRSGRETVEQRFTWERIASDLEGVYSSLVAA